MSFDALDKSVRQALGGVREQVVLAVSGGADSMVLMHAAARVAPSSVAAVATFDHATGKHARDAAALVMEQANILGLRFVSARASRPIHGESEWRAARWDFLRAVAFSFPIATAHTRDDHIETVAMRVMRGSGARGLAGMYASADIVRPLLEHTRAEVQDYAARHSIRFVDDPTNKSREYLRNRLRLDILPALRRVDHGFDDALLQTSRRAAGWRDDVEDLVRSLGMRGSGARMSIPVAAVDGLSEEHLRILAPAIAARAGVRLDRRGTHRLAAFLAEDRRRGRIQLSGGYEVERIADKAWFFSTRAAEVDPVRPLNGDTRWGAFQFRTVQDERHPGVWSAHLPADRQITIRAWEPGDRIHAAGTEGPRRVKRFLSDAHIAGADRRGWPVVLVEGAIVWIPGVRRAASVEPDYAAGGTTPHDANSGHGMSNPERGMREKRVSYVCERIDR